MEDRALVQRTLAGDSAAFTELVRRYRNMVYGTALHYLGHREEAQDAAQEAFVHAYARLRQLRDPARFAPWLRRATIHACGDLRRRRLPTLPGESEGVCQNPDVTTRLFVRESLSLLSEKTRLVVTLCYLGGYSHAEIADYLEIPLNTVRSRLQQAKRQLRQEMQEMVSDTLNQAKPDERWTRQVVEEALRRGEEARRSFRRSEAVRHYDDALTALDAWTPDLDQKRLRMQALRQKETALDSGRNHDQALILLTQALEIAMEIGDRKAEAELRQEIGVTYVSKRDSEQAVASFQAALALYQGLEDVPGQGECLLSLGLHAMTENAVTDGRRFFREARPFLERAGYRDWMVVCDAMRNMLQEIGEAQLPRVILWRAVCDMLHQSDGRTRFSGQPGYQITRHTAEDPAALLLGGVFFRLSHPRFFLDQSAAVGDYWVDDSFSYTDQPLQATLTIRSRTEHITTPAGAFSDCLRTEHTTQRKAPSEAAEKWQSLDFQFLCGITEAWYAPGVGLVQLHARVNNGAEAILQLQTYSIAEGNNEYLPLAVGNAWTYGWANIPALYDAREHYRVASHCDDVWHLEHWAYARKRG